MRWGGDAFEALLLDAARDGQRVLHLSGHTHWSDVFEAEEGPRGLRFARRAPSPCPTEIAARAALINTQSATRSGYPLKRSARGWGFSELLLDGDEARLVRHRYGVDEHCSDG
jgi:hypothetical protein